MWVVGAARGFARPSIWVYLTFSGSMELPFRKAISYAPISYFGGKICASGGISVEDSTWHFASKSQSIWLVNAVSGLIVSLVKHADVIMFSAAVPGQPGQHHVNCQWPEYWQEMFNAHGYTCNDLVRWIMWDHADIEPWYRQNMFMATRAPEAAAREDRIRPVVHPDMFDAVLTYQRRQYEQYASEMNSGVWPVSSYVSLLRRAAGGKLKRKFTRIFKAS